MFMYIYRLQRKWVMKYILLLNFFCIVLSYDPAAKYSQDVNVNLPVDTDLKSLNNPFRMSKLNLLWGKATKRLTDNKLKILYSELKVHDKEELTLKKLVSDDNDKDGLKEADVRKKFKAIIVRFGLGEFEGTTNTISKEEHYLNQVTDEKILKAIFKDKKLNKLWTKAEQSGFSEVELKSLREEFQHHQDKVDEYYALVQSLSSQSENYNNNLENELNTFENFDESEKPLRHGSDPTNQLREKHSELKKVYDNLYKVASTGPASTEFEEPKVAGLWKLAVRGNFNQAELESLHTELKHYEHRLTKVRYLSGQLNVLMERGMENEDFEKLQQRQKGSEGQRVLEERVAKQQRKVEKIHEDLELRILQRHSEL